MASSVLGASAELTGEATKMAVRSSSDFARRLGDNVVQRLQPNSIPPEVLEQLPPDFLEMMKRQAFLKQHGVGRVAMVGDVIDADEVIEDEAKLEARVSLRARALVEAGVVLPGVPAELRLVAAKETVDDPVSNDRLSERFERTAWFARRALAHDHDVTSVPFSDPITPVESKDSPMDTTARRATWREITAGLILWSKQLEEGAERHPSMVNFMGDPFSSAILEDWEGERQLLEHYKLLVLKRVATFPEDNLLVPAGQAEISEDPDGPGPIWTP